VKGNREDVAEEEPGWIPPILTTTATTGEGIDTLMQEINSHCHYLKKTGEWEVREQNRLKNEVENLLQAALLSRWNAAISSGVYNQVLDRVLAREISPRQAAHELIQGAE
jgi:LAO/AO transport system kinase